MANNTPLPDAAVSRQNTDAGPNETSFFWQRLEYLAATRAAVFKLVVGHLETGAARALCGVNRAMRLAVNSAVNTVVCNYNAPFDRLDLGLVFTDASCLVVDLQPPHPAKLTAADTAIFLNHVCKSSPVLLRKMQLLRMTFHSMPANTSFLAGTLAAFLSMFPALQAASFECSSGAVPVYDLGTFHFKGEGATPAGRTAHLQRQLALLPTSPHFLAPPAWPACGCLISLTTARSSSPQNTLQLTAAMQTTSLVSLTLTPDADTSPALSAISNLHSLTSLSIDGGKLPAADALPVLASIAALTNLRSLDLATSLLEDDALAVDIPASWSQLTCLTSLRCNKGFMGDPSRLAALQHLQVLDLGEEAAPVFSLTVLFPLTRLGCLVGSNSDLEEPEEQEEEAEDGGGGSDGGGAGDIQEGRWVVVPAAWREGLHSLTWSCSDSFCLPVVAQLSACEFLELHDVKVTPEVCRVLGELPLLASVNISTSTPLAEVPIPAIPRDLLPSLHSLAPLAEGECSVSLGLAAENLTPLHVLARWTNIPHPIRIHFNPPESVHAECLALKGWSANWVVSVLGSLASLDKDQPSLLLADDADADVLLAALRDGQGAIWSMGSLWLGRGVTQAALGRLLRCEQLPDSSLFIHAPPEEVMPYAVGWEGGLELTSSHFTGLLAAGPFRALHDLTLICCCKLDDEGVAALASAAGELRHLVLLGTTVKVGDSALAAVAVGCRHLERLVLKDTGRVTVAGLRLLLTLAAGLNVVGLCGIRAAAAEKLRKEIEAVQSRPAPVVFDAWDVEVTDGMLTITRKLR